MPPADLLVLAGGFGTRLRAAVADVPKPLAPVGQRPFLHYQIENWTRQGIRSLVFLLYHEAEQIAQFLESERSGGALTHCQVRAITEPQPLGTGGAVADAVQQLGLTGSFLVANADTWLGGGVEQMIAAEAPAIAAVQIDDSARYGALVLEERERIDAFEEKGRRSGPAWINAGLYHLCASEFREWQGQPFSLENEFFPRLVRAQRLHAVALQAEFIDIGVPADYLRFCRWIESGRLSEL